MDQRLHRLAVGMGIAGDDLCGRVRVVRERVLFDDEGQADRLLASLHAWGTRFLLVDSFRRTHRGNDWRSDTMNGVYLTLDRIRREVGCGVVLIDHHRKRTGEREMDAGDQALAGSTDKRNMADFHAAVEDRDGRVVWTPDKSRHGAKRPPIVLEVSGLSEGAAEDGPVTVTFRGHADRASDAVQDHIVALLEAVPGDGYVDRGEIVGRSTKYSRRSIGDGLTALKGRGVVRTRPSGRRVQYALTDRDQGNRAGPGQ